MQCGSEVFDCLHSLPWLMKVSDTYMWGPVPRSSDGCGLAKKAATGQEMIGTAVVNDEEAARLTKGKSERLKRNPFRKVHALHTHRCPRRHWFIHSSGMSPLAEKRHVVGLWTESLKLLEKIVPGRYLSKDLTSWCVMV